MVTSFRRKTRLKTLRHAWSNDLPYHWNGKLLLGDFIELSDLAESLHMYWVTPGGEVNIHLAYEFYN